MSVFLRIGRKKIGKHSFINENGEIRLIKFLLQTKKCNMGAIRKALRNKDIRINGNKVKEDIVLHTNDTVEIFLPNDFSNQNTQKIDIPIVFEDDNILVVNKPQGVAVHAGDSDDCENNPQTLIKLLQEQTSSELQLCHRIDRNTGGLVLLAKNRTALEEILAAIENHSIKKFYRCIVYGKPNPTTATLTNYLSKNSRLSKVFVHSTREKGDLTAITTYKTLKTCGELSLLEVSIATGRMHQIRAQLSHAGYPILGDGKYGNTTVNRKFKSKVQQLFAFRLCFDFPPKSKLSYLSGTSIEIAAINEADLNQFNVLQI